MWPAQSWATVIEGIVRRYDCQVVITGLAEERDFIDEIVGRLEVPVLNLSGRTTQGRLTALLARADLVVTLDTLVAPLARAMGREVVTLMPSDTPNWSRQRLVELGSLGIDAQPTGPQPWSVSCKWRRTGVVERCQSRSCVGIHGMGRIRPEAVLSRIAGHLGATRPAEVAQG
jgi:ADP-heptose:LPS heptosyltransferase